MSSPFEHTYRYPFSSALTEADGAPCLRLAADAPVSRPDFFRGTLTHPVRTARMLRVLAELVRTRFFVPANVLQRILAQADPVVTVSPDAMRFEGFSACCGVYGRLDLAPAAFDPTWLDPGTTNVDFGPSMRSLLGRVRPRSKLSLHVGAEAVVLVDGDHEAIERKVPLPVRWLRGFVEVQAVQAEMTPAFTVGRAQATRLLRDLPRVSTRGQAWLSPSGDGVRMSASGQPDAIPVSGIERLRLLEPLLPEMRELRVYSDPASGASAYCLDAEDLCMTFVLSPGRARGFSGEGRVRAALAADQDASGLARVRAALAWQGKIDPVSLASRAGVGAMAARQALAALGTRGLVGYDLERGAYFHRELPFDLNLVAGLHPRLVAAQRLVDAGAVTWVEENGARFAVVEASGGTHRVQPGEDGQVRCTCTWYARHAQDRGPCRHALAAEMVAQEEEP